LANSRRRKCELHLWIIATHHFGAVLTLRFVRPSSHHYFITSWNHRLEQQEVGQFQNRLGRAMAECQDKARDMMKPGYENDAKQMAKVEDVLLGCISKTVDEYIGKLKPLKERIAAQLK